MSQFITPSVAADAPPPRNLTKELDAIYAAQNKYAPQTYANEAQFSPQYNRLSLGNLAESALGYTDAAGTYHPGTAALGESVNRSQRSSDIADVSALGPQASAAYLAANPELAYARGNLTGRVADSPLLARLNSDAAAGLAANGALSPQDIRAATQGTVGQFANNGQLYGNNSVAAQALARDSARRSRIAAAQQFATGVQGLNQSQNVFANAATGTLQSTLSDPYQAILSRSGGAGAQNYARVNSPIDLGAYGQDLFNTNYNAGVNLAIQQSNAEANTRSSIATVASGFSDARLKQHIVPLDKTKEGIQRVEFTYRSDNPVIPPHLRGQRYRGVIAQDVQLLRPDAIMLGADGYLRVRYDKIGVNLEAVEPLKAVA